VIFIFVGEPLSVLAGLFVFIAANGLTSMIAYAAHYRALEMGPVAIVSPVGAGYAVVGVLLAIVFLGERPALIAILGMVVVVIGTMLVSTDLHALRAGLEHRPPGLPLALVSAVMFGLGGFLLGYIVQRSGDWVAALWVSRLALLTAFVPVMASRRGEFVKLRSAGTRLVALAIVAGLADLVGVTTYSAGAEAGYISIVIAASAVFPVVAVALSVRFLHERLVLNQAVGAGLVVAGLLMLGIGSL
jgi:uncharacterized membrane protein